MIADNGIRISNIYYMLSYAFTVLKNDGYDKLASEDFENTADLLSAILAKGIAVQLKRGLGKEYISVSEPLSTLKGKIDITSSIKSQTMIKKKLICDYDEFSVNTKHNQILKTTVNVLLKSKDVPDIRKKELKKLMLYFKDIDTIDLHSIDWNMRFHRNNANYQMLMNICYLILKSLLQNENDGKFKMQKFLDEEKLHDLYEKFILEYYKKHLPSNVYDVGANQIKWAEDNKYLEMLPNMKSDIYIKNKNTNEVLIIDAKFYKSITKTNHDTEKFISDNLYQIFTYVKNEEFNLQKQGIEDVKVSGMLLYAQTDHQQAYENDYSITGNKISVHTLDLRQEFKFIKDKLNKISKTI